MLLLNFPCTLPSGIVLAVLLPPLAVAGGPAVTHRAAQPCRET
jgi:hypothetical protein